MTLYNKRKNKLVEDLKNREYRDAFVEESINVGLPFQIRSLRKQRDLTQEEFASECGMKQELICRYEGLDSDDFSIKTLNKIAKGCDIGLVVRFVPIGDLVKWELNLNSESLKVASYKDDSYFRTPE